MGGYRERRAAGRLGSVGIELSVATVGGLLGGSWLDAQLDTDPWLALSGAGFGMFVGFYMLITALQLHARDGED